MNSRPLRVRLSERIAIVCAALAASATLAAPGPRDWTITSLGTLPSAHPFSVAEGVNNRGDIVGWSTVFDTTLNSNRTFAVLWQDGRMLNLGEGNAQAVNDHGTIAGSVTGGLSLYKGGQWRRLGLAGAPFAINKSEAIAGWAFTGRNRGYLLQNDVLHEIGTFGGDSSAATALNDRGVVAGYASTAGGNDHAFVYEAGVMKDLGTLNGGFVSRAHDINNHGVVVGEAWDASGNSRPFIFDGVMRQMFATPDCCVVPRAINDHGAVVGTTNGNASFLWQDGVFTRLEQLPAVAAAGWTQLIPFDINDRGWIVGMGRKGAMQPPATQEWQAFVLKGSR